MVQCQIQLPDALHAKAQAIATAREIPFAEIVRRGIEYMVSVYPETLADNWDIPALDLAIREELSDEAIKVHARMTLTEERLSGLIVQA